MKMDLDGNRLSAFEFLHLPCKSKSGLSEIDQSVLQFSQSEIKVGGLVPPYNLTCRRL